MKLMKTTRLLGIALIVSLLMAVIPAAPALGANEIDLSPSSGQVGDEITLSGDDFYDETYFQFCFSDESESTGEYIGDDVTSYSTISSGYSDEDGEYSDTFDVPSKLSSTNEEVTAGTYYIYATMFDYDYDQIIVSKTTFTVLAGGEIEIDPEEGPVDTEVEITGEDFADDEEIEIEFDGDEIDIEDGDDETDSDGDFSCTILIPECTAGEHDIDVTVGGTTVTAEFTVEPDIVISPQSGEAGDSISISGTGFARRDYIVIYFNNEEYPQSVQTDSNGSFYLADFEIPDLGLSSNTYYIEAEDEAENTARVPFTLNTISPTTTPPTATTTPPTATTTPTDGSSLDIAPDSGAVGSSIAIGGAGFTPNGTASILFNDVQITTKTIESSGLFAVTIAVPSVPNGVYTITVEDGEHSSEIDYTVYTDEPSAPPPLEPRNEANVESQVSFDWEDVTGASTYTLQVSSDSSFSESSLVLNKSALEASEYLMTEQEALALTTEATYYWRVQAVDSASNAGAWSGTGVFTVSPPFSFPTWAIIVLSIFGALLFFGLGYWLGRRTAFFY